MPHYQLFCNQDLHKCLEHNKQNGKFCYNTGHSYYFLLSCCFCVGAHRIIFSLLSSLALFRFFVLFCFFLMDLFVMSIHLMTGFQYLIPKLRQKGCRSFVIFICSFNSSLHCQLWNKLIKKETQKYSTNQYFTLPSVTRKA